MANEVFRPEAEVSPDPEAGGPVVMRFKFAHVRAVRPGGSARLLDPPSAVQRGWLAAMNLGPPVFFGPKEAGRSP